MGQTALLPFFSASIHVNAGVPHHMKSSGVMQFHRLVAGRAHSPWLILSRRVRYNSSWPLGYTGPARVFLIHPDNRPASAAAHEEGIALIHAVEGWSCAGSRQLRVKSPASRRFLGRGQIDALVPEITALLDDETLAATVCDNASSLEALAADAMYLTESKSTIEGEVLYHAQIMGEDGEASDVRQAKRSQHEQRKPHANELMHARCAVFVNAPTLKPSQQHAM